MSQDRVEDTDRRQRLEQVLAEYLRAEERGQPLDRERLLAEHPDLADELGSFFRNRSAMQRMAEKVQPYELPTEDFAKLAAFPAVGETVRYFGDYELLEELARGGMGVVYKARQISLNRIVALKMILAGHLATESDVQRFRAEAEAAANLDHPGIVPIYEVGEYGGRHYFSMAYVEGGSLASKLKDGPLPPRVAAEYTKKIAESVSYAHKRGVIHRDLKPSNVLLDRYGEPKVTDFGLAKQVEADSSFTTTGQILGTPSFMPPEQAAGKSADIGRASDIYSVGAVLYALLTARPPFQSDSPLDTLRQVVERDPVSPRQLNAKVPIDLETICLKCLEKMPARRYSSAQAVADELARYLRDEPILARPISAPSRAWRWCRRNPAIASLSMSVILAMLVGTIVSTRLAVIASNRAIAETKQRERADDEARRANLQAARAKEASVIATAEAIRAKRAVEAEQAESKRAYRNHYAAEMNLVQRDWEANAVRSVLERLERTKPEHMGDNDLRGFEWFYWNRKSRPNLLTLLGHQKRVTSVAYSVDGTRIASGSADGTVKIWDALSGKELVSLRGHPREITSVAFSPDGTRIATANEVGEVQVWDTVHGNELLTFKQSTGPVVFAPDGKRVACGSDDGGVKVWNVFDGKVLLSLKADRPTGVAFSPDGTRIASVGHSGPAKVWDASTGTELLSVNGSTSIGFSQDGQRFACGSEDRAIKVYDAINGRELLTIQGPPYQPYPVAFGADRAGAIVLGPSTGRNKFMSIAFDQARGRAATWGEDSVVRVWTLADGFERAILKGLFVFPHCIALNPAGTEIVTGHENGSVMVWDGEGAGDEAALAIKLTPRVPLRGSDRREAMRYSTYRVAFNSKGTQIVTGTWGGTINLWDAATGQEVFTVKGHAQLVSCVAFSPDATRIVSGCRDGELKIWDAFSGKEILGLKGHSKHIESVSFNHDGTRIVSGSFDGTTKVWDVTSGRELLSFKGEVAVGRVVFDPEGRRIVAGYSRPGTIAVWDAASGRELLTLKGHTDSVMSVTFSADGTRILSGSYDGTARLWDTASGKELIILREASGAVTSAAFNHDETRIVTARWSGGGMIKVWDTFSGQELLTLRLIERTSALLQARFSGDGSQLISVLPGTIKVWTAQPRPGKAKWPDEVRW